MAHRISVLTDEISGDLEAALRFAAEEDLGTVDVRSVGGVNFLSLGPDGQKAVARRIRDAGLKVGCLATPLLKWPAPGRAAADMGDQFGFDPAGRTVGELYEDAFRAAELLGARNLRIFSLLRYDGFRLDDLAAEYDALLRLAERHDATLHVENEPVCNIATVPELTALMRRWNHARLRALLDVPNSWSAGSETTDAEILAVMPFVDQIHFKDRSRTRGRTVALGEGDIPFARQLPLCFRAAGGRVLTLVIETHVPDDQPGATRRSLAALRSLAAAADI